MFVRKFFLLRYNSRPQKLMLQYIVTQEAFGFKPYDSSVCVCYYYRNIFHFQRVPQHLASSRITSIYCSSFSFFESRIRRRIQKKTTRRMRNTIEQSIKLHKRMININKKKGKRKRQNIFTTLSGNKRNMLSPVKQYLHLKKKCGLRLFLFDMSDIGSYPHFSSSHSILYRVSFFPHLMENRKRE